MSDHFHQANQHAVALASEALKALLAVNTGAVAGLVAFAAPLADGPLGYAAVGAALRSFGAGIILTLVTFMCAYLAQYSAAGWAIKESRWVKWSYWLFWVGSIFAFIASVVCLWCSIDVLAEQMSSAAARST